LSTTTTTIKRHNHRVHPCDRQQKLSLLKHLVALHSDKEIVVIASQDISALEQEIDAENVSFKSDKELIENTKFQCDMIISLDLARDPESYVKRLGQAKTYALLLADDKEQQELYKIETLMKRTLAKEVIIGFEPGSYLQAQQKAKELKERQAHNAELQAQRDDKRSRADAKSAPRGMKREESKYLGKDENGKPIFSGKTKERNHRYDGTPKSEEEKRNSYRAKPRAGGEKRPWEKETRSGGNKPYAQKPSSGKPGDKKPWDREAGAGDKKPWDKKEGDKKPYAGNSRDKKPGDSKPYAKKPWDKNSSSSGDKRSGDWKNSGRETAKPAPKSTGRTIRIPISKPSKES